MVGVNSGSSIGSLSNEFRPDIPSVSSVDRFFQSSRNKNISLHWKDGILSLLEIRVSLHSTVFNDISLKFFNVDSVGIVDHSVPFLNSN